MNDIKSLSDLLPVNENPVAEGQLEVPNLGQPAVPPVAPVPPVDPIAPVNFVEAAQQLILPAGPEDQSHLVLDQNPMATPQPTAAVAPAGVVGNTTPIQQPRQGTPGQRKGIPARTALGADSNHPQLIEAIAGMQASKPEWAYIVAMAITGGGPIGNRGLEATGTNLILVFLTNYSNNLKKTGWLQGVNYVELGDEASTCKGLELIKGAGTWGGCFKTSFSFLPDGSTNQKIVGSYELRVPTGITKNSGAIVLPGSAECLGFALQYTPGNGCYIDGANGTIHAPSGSPASEFQFVD